MKKQIDLQLLATLGGGLLFNYLFWMERLALNLLVYSLFILIMLLLDKQMLKSKKMLLASASHLLAALLVVFNQSDLTIITWYISLAVFIGYAHLQLLRGVFTALLSAFLQVATAPVNLVKKILNIHFGNLSLKPILKPIKYIIIPIFILILFSALYRIANPTFDNYLTLITSNITTVIANIFNFFFADLSFLRFIHVILGILLTAGLLISFKAKGLEKAELSCEEKLQRKRRTKRDTSFGHEVVQLFAGHLLKRKMALKTENIIGIISFTALNLLLLSLNAIDIKTLWLGDFGRLANTNFSVALHEGTDALIMSIVLAMLVILYFFSGNLNFFSKNKTIRLLAYVWIAQNTFLVLSVLLRDYHYINMQGLTYKRIGVLIFLLLCTIGLATVYLKVAQQKTLFFLYKINGLIWYILLLTAGFVNWDVFIVGYNINNSNNISLDLNHLLDMSDKTLPLLDKNRNLLKTYLPTTNYSYYKRYTEIDTNKKTLTEAQEKVLAFDNDLNKRIENFRQKWDKSSWLSWNYRDWQTHQYFTQKKHD